MLAERKHGMCRAAAGIELGGVYKNRGNELKDLLKTKEFALGCLQNELKTNSFFSAKYAPSTRKRALSRHARPGPAVSGAEPAGLPPERKHGMCRAAAGIELGGVCKIVGTNSITSLESVKAPENELKTNSKRTQKCAENSAIRTQNARWRIRAAVLRRDVCAPLERTGEWVHTSRQTASRRMRHPILINFRGPRAHGDRHPEPDVLARRKKMLKIVGTNSTTPLESMKTSKNELKTNSFLRAKCAHSTRKSVLSGAINFPGAQTELRCPSREVKVP